MNTKVLYIGNILSGHGLNKTTIENLSVKFKEFCNVKIVSNKKNKILRLLDMIFVLTFRGKKQDYILIDTYSTSAFFFALFCSIICILYKIKYIPILHGGNLEHRLISNPKLSRIVFNNSYVNISPSIFLKEKFLKYGYKAVYIPNFIEISNFQFYKRNFPLKPNLIWVRSFDKIYNPKMAIKVLFHLKKKYADAKLCMIGPDKDGSMDVCKKLAIELGIQNDVNFAGKLSRLDWTNISKDYSIFINTTNFDNMPVSLIEIMSLGLPIISTNVGGVSYLVKDKVNGLLVSKNNHHEMVKTIENLLKNKLLYDLIIKNGREKAERFDWEFIKYKWIGLLSKG